MQPVRVNIKGSNNTRMEDAAPHVFQEWMMIIFKMFCFINMPS